MNGQLVKRYFLKFLNVSDFTVLNGLSNLRSHRHSVIDLGLTKVMWHQKLESIGKL